MSVGNAKECEDAEKTGKYDKPCLMVDPGMETRKLRVVGFPRAKYEGPIKVQVQVGNNVSNALPLTFSRVSERGALIGALLMFFAIIFVVVRLIWKVVRDYIIGSKRYSPWTSFFLDKETDSYRLSKFQLLLWTSVFVFGYVYLFLCRMLIQWKFELPPVPNGLPGMLAISAGTAVTAAGATETRGSKGSGSVYPSPADFVTTGGLVVGERFQFFVWTLVGAFGFVSLLLLTDPATLSELPKIPDNFLYLMGISSVRYLGGKLIRKPGPVVRALVISSVTLPAPPKPARLTIHLQGENLADNAKVKVDDKELRLNDEFSITPIKRQDQPPDPAFCNELDVILLNATDYLEGEHTLTLMNRDGQVASALFPVDPMSIVSVADTPRAAARQTGVRVTGKNFIDGTSASWKDPDPDRAVTAIPADRVTRVSATELMVRVDPEPTPGIGTLTLALSYVYCLARP